MVSKDTERGFGMKGPSRKFRFSTDLVNCQASRLLLGLLVLILLMIQAIPLRANAPAKQASAGETDWVDLGGPGCNAELLVHDQAGNIHYLGTASRGVWKYQNGEWVSLGGIANQKVYGLLYEEDGGCLFALTNQGAFRCNNPSSGPTWTDMGWREEVPQFDFTPNYKMLFDHMRQKLYVSSAGSIWRCDEPYDNPSWTDTGMQNQRGEFILDEQRNVLYIGGDPVATAGVWRCDSPDLNPVWIDISGDTGILDVSDMVFDTSRNILYASVYQSGLWRCDAPDSTPSWILLSPNQTGRVLLDESKDIIYVTQEAALIRCKQPDTSPQWASLGRPEDKAMVVLWIDPAKNVLYAETNYGSDYWYWRCDSPDAIPAWVALDGPNRYARTMTFDDLKNTLCLGTDGFGVWQCDSPVSSPAWTDLGGVGDSYVWSTVYDPNNRALYASTERYEAWRCDGLPADPSWSHLGDMGSGNMPRDLALDLQRDILYAGMEYGGVVRCSNPDTLPAWNNTGGINTRWVGRLEYDGERNALYAGVDDMYGRDFWRCDQPNSSPIWTGIGGTLAPTAFDEIDDVLYAGGYRCDNPDTAPSWSSLGWKSTASINALAYDPAHDLLYAGTDRGLWRCENPRTAPAWADMGAVGDYQITCLAYDSVANRLYAGTNDVGVWRCDNPNTWPVWGRLGGEVVNMPITCLALDEINRTLYAGTAGWGVWYTDLTAGVAIDQSNIYYFAEGYTAPGFQEYLCLANPQAVEAQARIEFSFADQPEQEIAITLPAASRVTLDINQIVGEGKSVSMKISSNLSLATERPMYFTYGGITGGHVTKGSSTLSNAWYFAEGYTGPGFDEYICVFNPGNSDASLDFGFQTKQEGKKTMGGFNVPGMSRRTFRINDLLGYGYEDSLSLSASQPVVAERVMYFDFGGWTGGSCVMGATSLGTDYYFAEGTTQAGFAEYLTLQNPESEDITVGATYQLPGGFLGYITKSYRVPAGSRSTIYVPSEVGLDLDVSVQLSSSSPFLAERPTYFDYTGYGANWTGGHCVIGAEAPALEWFFGEGCTLPGFHEYLCLQNPGDTDATVEITYLTQEAGPLPVQTTVVPARSRITSLVNIAAGEGYQLSCRVRVVSGPAIVAERPMYFDYNGWDGGHDALGVVP